MNRITMTRKYGNHLHNTNSSIQNIYTYIYIFPAREAYVMWTHNSDVGRRSPEGSRVLCWECVPIRHINSSGRAIYHDLLIRRRLYVAWTSVPVVEFRLLHTVVVCSISSGGDHSAHCWWDLMRSKQQFSALYVACRCLPDFLIIVILTYIYICSYPGLSSLARIYRFPCA